MICRLSSSKLEETKTPSPRHRNPRKKQKLDEAIYVSEDQIETNKFRNVTVIGCVRWQNRKPFRRAAKKRVDLRSLSSLVCRSRQH